MLLAGMKAPATGGRTTSKPSMRSTPNLQRKHAIPLYPFFLDGVALDPKLVIDGRPAPDRAGIAEIVKRILPEAEALVARATASKAAAKN